MADEKELTMKEAEEERYLKNNGKEDFTYMWGGIEYIVKAGSIAPAPRFRAEHALKHYTTKQEFEEDVTKRKNELEILTSDQVNISTPEEKEVEEKPKKVKK